MSLAAKFRQIDRLIQLITDIVAHFRSRQQAVEFYCFAQRIYDNTALLAPGQVALDFSAQCGRCFSVDKIGELVQQIVTVFLQHFFIPD